MRRLIETTALATTILLLAGCDRDAAPVANNIVEPAAEPAVNMVDDGNITENVSAPPTSLRPPSSPPPPEPTTDGSDDRVSGN